MRITHLAIFSALGICLHLSSAAQAASISIDPAAISGVMPGEQFLITVRGNDFRNADDLPGTLGGGIDFHWDPAVLTIDSLDDVEIVLFGPGGGAFDFSDKGTLDAVSGSLLNFTSGSFVPETSPDFVIARITFTALSAGNSSITLDTGTFELGGANVWVDQTGLEVIPDLQFVPGTVHVAAVPLPSALVLLPAALFLMGRRTLLRA